MARVLLDHSVPRPLARHLARHSVETALDLGWDRFSNGVLLRALQDAGFDIFVTCDQNLRFQQNLSSCPFGLVVLSSNRWKLIQPQIARVAAAVDQAGPGSLSIVEFTLQPKPKPPTPNL